ncbi:MAG TPA: hypothetical protein VMH78_05065, partial [Thermoplasmata archaeon]|nr:hypothetical protein [Thermoplasmata archaeon]
MTGVVAIVLLLLVPGLLVVPSDVAAPLGGEPPRASVAAGRSPGVGSPEPATVAAATNARAAPSSAGPAGAPSLLSYTTSTGAWPETPAFDPSNGFVYVSNEYSCCPTVAPTVSIFSGSKRIASVGVGSDPAPPIFDPANGLVYVENRGSGTVTVINGTRSIANVTIAGISRGFGEVPGVDPVTGLAYFPYADGGHVAVVNGTRLLALIRTDHLPQFATYDPHNGFVYVVNEWCTRYTACDANGTVSVIHGTQLLATVGVGSFPDAPTVDSHGYVYVANSGACNFYTVTWNCTAHNVTVLNGTRSVRSLPVSTHPYAALFDPVNHLLYVTHKAGVEILNLTNLSAGAPFVKPFGWFGVPGPPALDPTTGNVLVPQECERYVPRCSNISVLEGTTIGGTISVGGTDPGSPVYAAPLGCFYVASGDYYGNLTVLCPTGSYSATFVPAGLPTGANWTVWVGNRTLTGSGPLVASNLSAGALSIDASTSANVSVPYVTEPIVIGANATIVVDFVPALAGTPRNPPVERNVTIREDGLPNGTSWSVTLAGDQRTTTSDSIVFQEPAGNYYLWVPWVSSYEPTPGSETVTVPNADLEVDILFTWVTGNSTFAMTFYEAGLPAGTSWSVTVGSTQTASAPSSIAFVLPNGTYSFSVPDAAGYSAVPAAGTFRLDGEANWTSIVFVVRPPPTFPLSFAESGLPDGTSWGVQIDGVLIQSTQAAIVLQRPNGTYNYSIEPLAGWLTDGYSGTASIAGGPSLTTVEWRRAVYEATFTERFLADGLPWWINVSGEAPIETVLSGVSTVLPNGTYDYTASAAGGSYQSPGGTFEVAGGPVGLTLSFVRIVPPPPTYGVVFVPTGLPGDAVWSVTVGSWGVAGMGALSLYGLSNGTYTFVVDSPVSYVGDPSVGSFEVRGGNVTVGIAFALVSAPRGAAPSVPGAWAPT